SGVEWRVTRLGHNRLGTVGGAEIEFFSGGAVEDDPSADTVKARALPFLERQNNQPVQVTVDHPYLESADATLQIADAKPKKIQLVHGRNVFTIDLPGLNSNDTRTLEL